MALNRVGQQLLKKSNYLPRTALQNQNPDHRENAKTGVRPTLASFNLSPICIKLCACECWCPGSHDIRVLCACRYIAYERP